MLYSIISMNNRIKTLVTAIAITAFALTALAACGGEPEIVGVRGAAGAGDPVFPTLGNGGYDVSHYDLDLNIDPDANTLAGVATIDVRATENLEAFNFDFAGPDVSSVRVNDEPAKFTREGIELTIEPAKMIPNDSDFTVVVAYGGTPEPFLFSDFDKINGWFPFEGSVLLASGGFQWYPNNQTPADPATYTMRLTVPKPLTATATGKLTATVDNGDTSTYVWETTTPVGQALAAVAVTVSDSVLESIPGPNGLTINNYFPAGTPQGTKNRFKVASEIIEHFTGLFGPFPYDSFGITFLEGRMPGSGFSAPGRVFTNVTNQKTLAHEIAHQWFAGSV
ncbi:MAG: hypothetical protein O6922_08485, partial [Chloroflexi bacterium]|nr:hypothetical protein [Chloroflexota bacterium]